MSADTAKKKTAAKKAASNKAAVKKSVKKKSVAKKASVKKAAAGTAQNSLSYQQRYQMISEAAYLIAEKQNFIPGSEMDHWLQAEKQIDSWIKLKKIKVIE